MEALGTGGAGGTGIAKSGTIKTLTNSGTISGGFGGAGTTGGVGGAGLPNGGTIGTLTNSGTISGGNGGGGSGSVAAARAARACRTLGRSRR